MCVGNILQNVCSTSLDLNGFTNAGYGQHQFDGHGNRAANVHVLRSWRKSLLGNLKMVWIEWNIRKSKRSHRVCDCCSLESTDRISELNHSAHNDGPG